LRVKSKNVSPVVLWFFNFHAPCLKRERKYKKRKRDTSPSFHSTSAAIATGKREEKKTKKKEGENK
jgi:hypothetical protein